MGDGTGGGGWSDDWSFKRTFAKIKQSQRKRRHFIHKDFTITEKAYILKDLKFLRRHMPV